MWVFLIGLAVLYAGLVLAFSWLEGSRHMATYDPGRGWQEGRGGIAANRWGAVQPPVEPKNTWSNLAYYVAGWIPAAVSGPDEAAPIVFGLAMTWLAVGSAMFHGTLTRWAQRWDHSGMLTVFPVLAVFAAASTVEWVAGPMIWAGFAGAALGVRWFPARLGEHGSNSMNAAIGAFLVLAALPALSRGSWELAAAALTLFVAGAALSLGLDKASSSLLGLWKHAAWHVLTAAALCLTYLAQG